MVQKTSGNPAENPLQLTDSLTYHFDLERTVHKARTFRAAADWDIKQQLRMTPRERWLAARQLRERVFGRNNIARSLPRGV